MYVGSNDRMTEEYIINNYFCMNKYDHPLVADKKIHFLGINPKICMFSSSQVLETVSSLKT